MIASIALALASTVIADEQPPPGSACRFRPSSIECEMCCIDAVTDDCYWEGRCDIPDSGMCRACVLGGTLECTFDYCRDQAWEIGEWIDAWREGREAKPWWEGLL